MKSNTTVEPQYNACVDIAKQHGLSSLGIMSNQVWHDDPRRLAFMLARYKFVSKMLAGKQKVAEIGCGDAFASRIVLQEVSELHVYDIDEIFVHDIEARNNQKWPLSPYVHNIIAAPLPQSYDAIYSLDLVEHIEQSKEHFYIEHIKQSLKPHGVVIIGSPSLESQTYASPQSKIGHINCKTGRDYLRYFQQYFHQVFLFSMNDEVIHTGFYPMAHYLFAICCEAK